MLNFTPEEASRICMDQCRAMCCRGPLILRLEPEEVAVFHREAVHLGTTADIFARCRRRRQSAVPGPSGGVLPDAGSSHLRVPHLRTEAAGLPGVSSPAGAGLRHFRLGGRLV